MPKAAAPITITLTPQEAAFIQTPAGAGGQQTFQQELLSQLQNGNTTLSLNDEQVGKLFRYMTQYGQGGFQGRLQKAFRRPLSEFLAA